MAPGDWGRFPSVLRLEGLAMRGGRDGRFVSHAPNITDNGTAANHLNRMKY